MIELLSLRISERNYHPEVFGRFFIFQKSAKLGRVVGELKQADFDFTVETGCGNIDGIGDIGKANVAQGARGGNGVSVQAIGMAIFERRHLGGVGRDEATLRMNVELLELNS